MKRGTTLKCECHNPPTAAGYSVARKLSFSALHQAPAIRQPWQYQAN